MCLYVGEMALDRTCVNFKYQLQEDNVCVILSNNMLMLKQQEMHTLSHNNGLLSSYFNLFATHNFIEN